MIQKQKVSVGWQMLFSIIPIVNLWAAYRIEKLLLALLIFIPTNLVIGFLIPFPFSLPIVVIIHVLIMRKWSKDWNKAIDTANYSANLA
jgi:hypothetical protein